MADLPRRIVLVYDRVNKWGGAERVLLALHELFPEAPLYTAVYNSETAEWAKVFPEVIPSFLQKFPGAKTRHELYPWITPLAFESFDFSGFDAAISVTSADAKGIITRPGTFHLCYCLTPTRYLWSHRKEYQKQVGSFASPLFNYLKSWDRVASHRPDHYIAISKTVQQRIADFYKLPSDLVYPPVDIEFFSAPAPKPQLEDYFLYVGRLVGYKQAEILVQTFNDLQLPLAIIGIGSLEKKLRQIAKANIHFLGFLTNLELASYYQHAKALLFYHEEDFGIVPVEAMAAGTPVIGLNRGGVAETVIHNETGLLIDNLDDLKKALNSFDRSKFNNEKLRDRSRLFSKAQFQQEFAKVFTSAWKKYKSTSMS